MTIKEKIEKQLKSDIELVSEIERLLVKINIMNNNERDKLLAGFTRNMISHFLAINILIEKKLYNSAFALVRIYFENIIKLKYMYYIMDDLEIEKMYKDKNWDKYFPTMKIMTEKIDNFYEIGTSLYSEIKNNAYKTMNDYTHTGPTQISRHFNESNFDDKLILETLESSRMLLLTSSIVLIEGIGLSNGFISDDEIKKFTDMCINILN